MSPRDLTPDDIAKILSEEILINNGILSEAEAAASSVIDDETIQKIIRCANGLKNPNLMREASVRLSEYAEYVKNKLSGAAPAPAAPKAPAPAPKAPAPAPAAAPRVPAPRAPSPAMTPPAAPKPTR